MIIELVFPGKTKEKYIAAGIEDFTKRIGRFAKVHLRNTRQRKDTGNISPKKYMEEEGRELFSLVSSSGPVVALDRRGLELSSEGFSELLGKWKDEGRRTISFVIGGHYGLPEVLLKDASFVLSLSQMTFTHEMARLILLEQIYRAFAIMANTGYHK